MPTDHPTNADLDELLALHQAANISRIAIDTIKCMSGIKVRVLCATGDDADYVFAACKALPGIVASLHDARAEALALGEVRQRGCECAEAETEDNTETAEPERFDLVAHLANQREWSRRTFGPSKRTAGILAHIAKELEEVRAKPDDLSEWIDVIILALDGAWRHGYEPDEIVAALVAKQSKNEARSWPDWRERSEHDAIEHDRSTPPDAETEEPTDAE